MGGAGTFCADGLAGDRMEVSADHLDVVFAVQHQRDGEWSTCYLSIVQVEALARYLDRLYDLAVDPA